MAARASAAPSEDAATSSSHWVVRNLGRPPAVESSSASSKSNFARKYLGAQEKGAYAHDFQRWHPNNHMVTIDRLNAVGKDVRAIGRWSQTHVSDINHAPMHEEGYFTWIIVREGDSWKIRKSIFSEKSDPFSTNDG
jgi:hypothetical protein